MAPERIGKYEVLGEIASGGQGAVYRAFDQSTGMTVAIKVLHAQYASNEAFVERFRREATLVQSIDHQNVVKIYDVGEADGLHFMALEYIPGSLGDLIDATGELPTDRAVSLAIGISAGIGQAHAQGIIHRDIKPQNVLLTPEGIPKVTDFGIARDESLDTMTVTGVMMGTPYYMSPEQADGLRADFRSDVYSLGCLLYRLLSGEVPFSGDTPIAILRLHVDTKAEPLRKLAPSVPSAVVKCVEKAMEKDPEKRYADASEMALALRRAVPDLVIQTGEIPVVTPPPVVAPPPLKSTTPENASSSSGIAQPVPGPRSGPLTAISALVYGLFGSLRTTLAVLGVITVAAVLFVIFRNSGTDVNDAADLIAGLANPTPPAADAATLVPVATALTAPTAIVANNPAATAFPVVPTELPVSDGQTAVTVSDGATPNNEPEATAEPKVSDAESILQTAVAVNAKRANISLTDEATEPTPIPVVGWTPVGDMNTTRGSPTATQLLDGTIFIFDQRLPELYHPDTQSFEFLSNADCEHNWMASATLLKDGNVLVTGGDSQQPNCAEIYDAETRRFTRVGDMNLGRFGHTSTLLHDGRVLIAGGRNSHDEATEITHAAAEIYDPITQTFSMTGELNQHRNEHAAALLSSGKVLISSGYPVGPGESGCFSLPELFDPETGVFTPISGSTFNATCHPEMTLLNDGTVLITTSTGLAEIYDPVTSKFRATGPMNTDRGRHGATILPSGEVLITGGFLQSSGPEFIVLESAEMFDPVTEEFTPIDNMTEHRHNHAAVLLPDGSVLLAGGDTFGPPIRSAEVWNPPVSITGEFGLSNTDVLPSDAVINDRAAVFRSHSYLIVDHASDWESANAFATSLGGYIVAINSVEEHAFVTGLARNRGHNSVLIGLNDIESEDEFVWSNGDPVTFTNWNPGEPSNAGPGYTNEDLVVLNVDDTALWNDVPSYAGGFIVEFDSAPVISRSSAPSVVSDGLIAWWTGDGHAQDIIGGNNGVMQNGATYAPGIVGQAFKFDGLNDYMSGRSDDFPSADSPRTISLWAKSLADPSDNGGMLFGYGNGAFSSNFALMKDQQDSGGAYVSFIGRLDDHRPSDGEELSSNRWHHIAMTYDGVNIAAFVDGKPVWTHAKSLNTVPRFFGLGRSLWLSNHFNGLIDEAKLYDRALVPSEVKAIYDAQTAEIPPTGVDPIPAPEGLIHWWTADGDGNDVIGDAQAVRKNGASFAAGFRGDAFSFDGVNDEITVTGASVVDRFTVELWVQVDSTTSFWQTLYATQPTGLWLRNGRIGWWDDLQHVLTGQTAMSTGEWHHIAITSDGSIITAYLDGEFDGSIGRSGALLPGGPGLGIGSHDAQEFFGGLIDEVRAYDRALTGSEIKSIFDAGSAGLILPPEPVVSPDGLVAWWTGDGTASDSARNHDAALRGGAEYAAGIVGQAFELSEQGDFVEVLLNNDDFNFDSNEPVTIEMWVNRTGLVAPENPGAGMHLLGKRDDCGPNIHYQMSLHQDSGVFAFGSNGDVVAPSNVLPVGSWKHIVVTFDGISFRLFIDGSLIDVPVPGSFQFPNNAPLLIGGTAPECSTFEGLMDEIKVYERALSSEEIGQAFTEVMDAYTERQTAIDRANNFVLPFTTNEVIGSSIELETDGGSVSLIGSRTNFASLDMGATIHDVSSGLLGTPPCDINTDTSSCSDPRDVISDSLGFSHYGAEVGTFIFGDLAPQYIIVDLGTERLIDQVGAEMNVGDEDRPANSFGVFTSIDGVNYGIFDDSPIPNPSRGTLLSTNSTISARYVAFYFGACNGLNCPGSRVFEVYVTGPEGQQPVKPFEVPNTAGPIGHWAAEGDAADGAGANDGILLDGASTTTGKIGQAFSFDGVNDLVVVPSGDAWSNLSEVTVSFWMNPSRHGSGESGGSTIVLSNEQCCPVGSWNFEYWTRDGLTFFVRGGETHGPEIGIPELDRWYHIVGTYDGTVQRLYLDGELEGTFVDPVGLSTGSQQIYIGTGLCPGGACDGAFYKGLLDEVMIYDRAISDSEVKGIFEEGSAA